MHGKEYRLSKSSLGKSLNKDVIIAFIKKQENHQGGETLLRITSCSKYPVLISNNKNDEAHKSKKLWSIHKKKRNDQIPRQIPCLLTQRNEWNQGQKTRGNRENMINGRNCLKDPDGNSESKKTKISNSSKEGSIVHSSIQKYTEGRINGFLKV